MRVIDSIEFSKGEGDVIGGFLAYCRENNIGLIVTDKTDFVLMTAKDSMVKISQVYEEFWNKTISNAVRKGYEKYATMCYLTNGRYDLLRFMIGEFDGEEDYVCSSYDKRLWVYENIDGIGIHYEFWLKGDKLTLTKYVRLFDEDYTCELDGNGRVVVE